MNRNYAARNLRKPSSEDLDDQIARFLAKGGTIKQIPMGISGEFASELQTSIKPAPALVGVKAAAELIGRSHRWLCDQMKPGNPNPPPYTIVNGVNRFERVPLIEWYAALNQASRFKMQKFGLIDNDD